MNKYEAFDEIIHLLEATANSFYSPDEKMWNILLKTRDRLEPIFVKELEKDRKRLEK